MRGIKIAIIVEGQTERVFKESLLSFLRTRLSQMPKLQFITYNGRIPKQEKLKRVVENLLEEVDHVIALTDVLVKEDKSVNKDAIYNTIKRQLRDYIEHRGSKKNGGYYLK